MARIHWEGSGNDGDMCNGCILHVGHQGQHRYRLGSVCNSVGVDVLVADNDRINQLATMKTRNDKLTRKEYAKLNAE